MIKISIILVCYNSKNYIAQTLNSIRMQCYTNYELIVIDGGSTDGTLKIINEFKDLVTTVVSEVDSGVYHAMNKGLMLAKGDVIGFLNSDDFYFTNQALEIIANSFSSNSKNDIFFSDLIIVDKKNLKNIKRYWDAALFTQESLKYGVAPPHPTFYIKKDLFLKIGFFNIKYKLASDFDFMLRALSSSNGFTYINEILVCMRTGGLTSNSFYNRILQNIEIINSINYNLGEISYLPFIIKKLMNRLIQKINVYNSKYKKFYQF